MTQVKITFLLEASDPDHSTGLTDEDYTHLMDQIIQMGGDDIEIEKVDD